MISSLSPQSKSMKDHKFGLRGVPLRIFGGPHLQIQTQFQTKKCHFPHPFSDLASKIHTRFQT